MRNGVLLLFVVASVYGCDVVAPVPPPASRPSVLAMPASAEALVDTVDVFLVEGSSNAASQECAPDMRMPPPGVVYGFNPETNHDLVPMYNCASVEASGVGSVWAPFAAEYLEGVGGGTEIPQRVVVLASGARGGSRLLPGGPKTWDPATGTLLRAAWLMGEGAVRASVSAFPNAVVVFRGVLWNQGNDQFEIALGHATMDEYQAALASFLDVHVALFAASGWPEAKFWLANASTICYATGEAAAAAAAFREVERETCAAHAGCEVGAAVTQTTVAAWAACAPGWQGAGCRASWFSDGYTHWGWRGLELVGVTMGASAGAR